MKRLIKYTIYVYNLWICFFFFLEAFHVDSFSLLYDFCTCKRISFTMFWILTQCFKWKIMTSNFIQKIISIHAIKLTVTELKTRYLCLSQSQHSSYYSGSISWICHSPPIRNMECHKVKMTWSVTTICREISCHDITHRDMTSSYRNREMKFHYIKITEWHVINVLEWNVMTYKVVTWNFKTQKVVTWKDVKMSWRGMSRTWHKKSWHEINVSLPKCFRFGFVIMFPLFLSWSLWFHFGVRHFEYPRDTSEFARICKPMGMSDAPIAHLHWRSSGTAANLH